MILGELNKQVKNPMRLARKWTQLDCSQDYRWQVRMPKKNYSDGSVEMDKTKAVNRETRAKSNSKNWRCKWWHELSSGVECEPIFVIYVSPAVSIQALRAVLRRVIKIANLTRYCTKRTWLIWLELFSTWKRREFTFENSLHAYWELHVYFFLFLFLNLKVVGVVNVSVKFNLFFSYCLS